MLTGGASAKDVRSLAPELRTTPEMILNQVKHASGANFAAYVRNLTPSAVSWHMPFLTLENSPQMSAAEYAAMLARNRAEVSTA